MTNIGTLVMKVAADVKDFNKKMDGVKKTAAGFGKALGKGAMVAGAAITGISAIAVKAAEDQERAEARLSSIAKTVTKATDEQINAMKSLASEQQKVSTFGDDVLIAGQSQLLSFGMTTDAAGDLTESLANMLAATKGVNATQEDAVNAANMFGKAMSGQVGALSRAGILLNETQAEILKNGTAAEKTAAMVEIMEQNYGGLAKGLAATSEGMRAQAKNAFGDIMETLGFQLIPMFNNLLSWVMENMPTIQNIIDIVAKVIVASFKFIGAVITDYLIPTYKAIKAWWDENGDAIIERVKRVGDTMRMIWDTVVQFVKTYVLPIFQAIGDWWTRNGPLIMDTVKTVFGAIITYAKLVWEILEVTLIPVLKVLWEVFKVVFKGVYTVVSTTIKAVVTVINGLLKTITRLMDKLTGAIKKLKEFFSFDGKKVSVESEVRETQGRGSSSGSTISSTRGQRANGGPVKGGSAYLVGERGPEKFIPGSDGTIVSSNDKGQIVINVNGSGDPDAVADAIVKKLRRQGVI